jgi:hypothetical protein
VVLSADAAVLVTHYVVGSARCAAVSNALTEIAGGTHCKVNEANCSTHMPRWAPTTMLYMPAHKALVQVRPNQFTGVSDSRRYGKPDTSGERSRV